MSDLQEFGILVRQRRLAARFSQEAVAALAFGNGDRKGFISTIENNRAKGLKPETARRLCAALGISRSDVPASLRWVEPETDLALATPDLECLADKIADQERRVAPLLELIDRLTKKMERRLSVTPLDAYRATLRKALDLLESAYGPAFGWRSFCIGLTVAYFYVFVAGLVSYASQGGRVGGLTAFEQPDWASTLPNVHLAALVGFIVVIAALVGFLASPFQQKTLPVSALSMPRKIWIDQRTRAGVGCILLGAAVALAAGLGTHPIVASMLIAIVGFGALSRLRPKRARKIGAGAGALVGLLESLLSDFSILGTIEGGVFGVVLGGVAGFIASFLAKSIQSKKTGILIGAGAGAATAGVATALVFFGMEITTVSRWVETQIGDEEFKVLSSRDHSFVLLLVIWSLLPVCNAVLDYLSYSVSLILASKALDKNMSGYSIALLALADLVLACVMAMSTVGLVIACLTLADAILQFPINPGLFIEDWLKAPFESGVWLTIMICSTLIWTLLHYFFVVLPILSSWVVSGHYFASLRAQCQSDIERPKFDLGTYTRTLIPRSVALLVYVTSVLVSFWLLYAAVVLASGFSGAT